MTDLHKHRSRMVTDGVTRAPHRAFLRAHGYDAIVGVAGCDKTLPGMLMGMVRASRAWARAARAR